MKSLNSQIFLGLLVQMGPYSIVPPPRYLKRRRGDAGCQGAAMASQTSLPADVLEAIAKQRGKNKAPTMTAEEIAKHRWGNRNGTSVWG